MRSTFIAILMFVGAVLGAVAQNTVFVSNVKGAPGEVVNVDVLLQNTDDVAAAEVVIPLVNKQLTYVDGSCVINSERANGHSLSAAVVDGALKIYIYSFSGAPLNGDDGRLASFSLKLGNSPAEYPLQPQVVLSDATGKALPVNTSAGAVTILAPQIEVVTPSVDFGRVPIMAQYTKNFTLRNSGTLPLEVSDLQFNDNAFSIAETSFTIAAGATRNITINYSPTVRGVVDKSITVVSNAANGNATVKLLAEPYSVNELHSSRVEGIAGEEVTVELRMNNMEAIVGLLTTFNLPNGIEYVDGSFAATERAASHTSMASFSNGKLSLILYSMKNTPMNGNDGVVATFRLRLNCNSGSYNIVPQNTVLSNAAQENMVSAVSGEYIVVKSPDIDGNTELDFGRTPVTEVAKANYSVRNNGKATLEISNVVFLAQGYKVANELPLTIEPGAVSVLNVEYLPTAEGAHSTSMNIYSNDPDEKMISVKVTGTVYEPNNLTFEGENLQNGDYVMSIGLDNYTGIVAMQMDIHWMPGMTTSSDRLKVSERLAGHSCSITKIDEDTYRFIAFSFGNNNIAGNKGKLFDLTFTPGNGTDYKDTPIVIDNVVLSSSGANNYTSQLALNVPASYSHYFVKFVCESEIVSETFQRAGTQIVQPQMPKRTGYTFGGWENVPELSPAEDVVYTGEYKVNKYKLNYLVNGVVFATDSIAYGSAITLIDAPVKEGHTFSGWSEAPATMPANDITIEGSFAVNTYNVIYKVDGEEYKVIPVTYGSEMVLIEAPAKEGHTFSGWSEAPTTMPAEDVVIEGSFTVNTYNVIYKVDGEEFATDSIAFGSEITLIEAPTKEGHTFSGWSEAPATMPAEDVVIEGSFTVNTYNVIYKVDGEEYKVVPVAYGSEIVLIDTPVKEGHTFSGWSEAPATMPASDITIEGSFTVNSYNVIYKVDGEEFQVVPVTYGSEITLIEAPVKEGHTFSGWSDAPATMPAEDVVIEGSFTVNTYNVIYKVDGEVYATDSVLYGNEIVLREHPVKEGHTFSGWNEVPATMPASDITIEGSFTVNSYNVIYKVDGEEYKVVPAAYGSEIVLIDAPAKEGHTFSGWSDAPATMPASDITIEGSFAVNTYNVIYKVDGEEYQIVPVTYGSEITLIEAPTKEGHTFSGWSEVPVTMPASDITIEGSFAVNSYNVIYKVDGEEYQVVPAAYGSEIVLIEEPTKEGYTFSGWSEAPATMPANDIVIEGAFAVNSYVVKYVVDGEEFATDSIAFGSEIVLREQPTKEGHTFSGWSEAPATMPAEDITIEGTFTVNSYNVIYKVDGEEYQVVPVTYGSEITLIEAPTKEGYTFSGWQNVPEIMPAEDITIEGAFTVNSYNVIYKVDGEEFQVVPITYGSEITLIETPTKEGHTFSGWSEAPATMPASDITIEGSFTVNSYNVIYKVDGEEYQVVPVTYGSEITLIEAPTKEGHTFSGWSEAPATMPASDITIEGSFTVNSYNVIYKVNGEEYHVVPVTYGSEITLIEAPTKEGYTFSGWSEAPATMPASDITIEGSFAVNSYNVIYKVDGEEYKVIPSAYGSEIILIDAPVKEGHTFSGWSEAPTTMPASDITIEGSFTVNSYNVIYKVDGEEFQVVPITYGSEITLIEAPTKEGHTFSGWSEAPTTMPAEDITIEGAFTVNSYNVIYKVDGEEYQVVPVTYGSEITLIEAPTKEGHTFSGWSEAPATMPAEDITIEGTFTVNNHTVTYLVDGEVYATETVAYGSEIVLRDEPTKEGHTFSGWSEAPATMPAEDVVIEGSFTVNTYNVIYKVDGEEYKVVPAAYGSEIVLIDAPVKEGHTFSGWSEAPATMPAEDVVIKGTFAVNYYNVVYFVDGEVYVTDRIAYGKEIVAPEHPVKEGYTFGGWRDVPKTMPAEDIEITSSFVVNGYKVIYKVDGEEYQSELVEYGSMIILPKYPIKEGHTFSGWQNVPESMPAEDIVIEGSFAVNSYNVIYKVDGEEFQVVPITYGSEITLIEAPTKEGHTFSGWSEVPATMPAEDVTIEGTFAVNRYAVNYKVDGVGFAVDSVTYGSEIILREEPNKEGHTFSGWSEAPATMPASDITIEGSFAVNTYNVIYKVDGEEYQVVPITYGSEITLIEAPTKEGYTFSGWQNVPESMPAEDITIEGAFTVNSYNVIYKVDGEEYQVVPAAYGSEIALIDAPVKDGHTFSGWSEAPTTMPASDITIEGSFTVNSYNVIYKVDGEEYQVVPVTYGSEITLIEAPTKEGHTFSGWSEAPTTMPASDITIEGAFTVNSYNVIYKVDGEEYQVVHVAYGSEIALIDAPTKEGHTFSGWSEAPATMPASDITIEGSFAVNTYNVIYKVDGEEFQVVPVTYGSEITLLDEPTKEGNTFSGWSEAPTTMPAEDITIEGSFTVNTYNVIYKVDGEEYKVVPAAYGSEIVLIDAPVKEGHTFSGWSEAPATMPAEDVVIKGTFAVNYYNVVYFVDGEVYVTDRIAYGKEIVAPEHPVKEGYTFGGWRDVPKTMPAEDIEITSSFVVNGYKVIYKVDGEEYQSELVEYGSMIILPKYPIKEGHTFSGWQNVPESMPAEDVVIEGSFTVNTYNVIYKVDGEEYQVVPVAYGSEITLIEAPTKEGHTFSGWSEAPATMPAEDVVIEGSFTVNTYNVIYKVDGEEYKVVPAAYGSEITLIEAPTMEGHTFSGWSEAPATMPAEDVVIEGSFTVNTYNVIYKVDGEEYKVIPSAYGSEIILIDAPVKEGHTFSGWNEAPTTMPAEDVVIEGSFTVNTYNVIYKVDGEEYKVVPAAYGSEIVLIDAPVKEGHTFSGWSEAPATMPASDITIEGSFTVNNYTVTYLVDGENYATETVAYGSEIVLRDEPTKEGHTFSGWSEAPETMPAEDVVIEGTFTVNNYTVTYLVDGEVYATETVAYGSAITLLEEPTKEGYTFSGWSEAPETMPAEDIVIEGSFSPITTINGVVYDAEDLLIYNLRGERIIDVDELERGIYIINGKKVWVE